MRRFLDEYKKAGVEFWGLTTQNEPRDGQQPNFRFNCMGWNSTTQRQWIVENLGPSLKNSPYNDTHLMMYDDQRHWAFQWTQEVYSCLSKKGNIGSVRMAF